MTAEPDNAEEPSTADRARALLLRQLDGLDALAEVGLEIVQALRPSRAEPDATLSLEAASLAQHRTGRDVRLTYAMQHVVVDRLAALDRAEQIGAAEADLRIQAQALHAMLRPHPVQPAPTTPTLARKAKIAEAVTDIIAKTETPDTEAYNRRVVEATEHLRESERYGDVLDRPMSDVIADICRDLGLEPDWQGLASRAWAIEEMQSGTVGAPLKFPSPWMGEGSRVGVEAVPEGVVVEEDRSTQAESQPGLAPQAEPLPPPIPAVGFASASQSPIQGERVEAEAPEPEPPEPEPEPPPPYTPPCLEDIYAAASRGPPALGLPGELPPLRPDGRPAAYRPPPCNYTHGFD